MPLYVVRHDEGGAIHVDSVEIPGDRQPSAEEAAKQYHAEKEAARDGIVESQQNLTASDPITFATNPDPLPCGHEGCAFVARTPAGLSAHRRAKHGAE